MKKFIKFIIIGIFFVIEPHSPAYSAEANEGLAHSDTIELKTNSANLERGLNPEIPSIYDFRHTLENARTSCPAGTKLQVQFYIDNLMYRQPVPQGSEPGEDRYALQYRGQIYEDYVWNLPNLPVESLTPDEFSDLITSGSIKFQASTHGDRVNGRWHSTNPAVLFAKVIAPQQCTLTRIIEKPFADVPDLVTGRIFKNHPTFSGIQDPKCFWSGYSISGTVHLDDASMPHQLPSYLTIVPRIKLSDRPELTDLFPVNREVWGAPIIADEEHPFSSKSDWASTVPWYPGQLVDLSISSRTGEPLTRYPLYNGTQKLTLNFMLEAHGEVHGKVSFDDDQELRFSCWK